jgi:hypothetical protein
MPVFQRAFFDPNTWLGKSLDVIGWQGDLSEVAKALAQVSGVPVKAKLAMLIFLRLLFLKDLHDLFFVLRRTPWAARYT